MAGIMILGGAGHLGAALSSYLHNNGEAHTCWPRYLIDITTQGEINRAIYSHAELYGHPEVVINCAGILSLQSELYRETAWQVNAVGPGNVAHVAETNYVRMVQISTDYVFDGKEGNYPETERCCPINYYGTTKMIGELETLHEDSHALVLRVPFRYDGPWKYPRAFSDQWISGRRLSEVVPDIIWAAKSKLVGILHIGGPRVCVLDMAREVSPDVEPCLRSDFGSFLIPRDVSLNSELWRRFRYDE